MTYDQQPQNPSPQHIQYQADGQGQPQYGQPQYGQPQYGQQPYPTFQGAATPISPEDERLWGALAHGAALVAVGELGASSVDILVRPWVMTPDYFATKCALTEEIKLALDDAGISIPYPQMDVHMAGGDSDG